MSLSLFCRMRLCLDCCKGRLGNSAVQGAFLCSIFVFTSANLVRAFHNDLSLRTLQPNAAAGNAKRAKLVYCIAPDMQ